MSKANSPIKVLRTALKRVQKAWTKGTWSEKQDDGNYAVCLEGAIFGYCNTATTQAQRDAHKVVLQIVQERGYESIPDFNDKKEYNGENHLVTQDDVIEVIKLAIIRIETGGMDDPEDDYLTDEEVDELLPKKK